MTELYYQDSTLSADVSRELAALVQHASFFARQELSGWLDTIASSGQTVDSMSEVPGDLIELLQTGRNSRTVSVTEPPEDDDKDDDPQMKKSKIDEDDQPPNDLDADGLPDPEVSAPPSEEKGN